MRREGTRHSLIAWQALKGLACAGCLALLAGCAPANYLYSFDLSDPGAVNFADFRRPDALEDADVKIEVRADPTEFKAIAVDITNKTDVPLTVAWDQMPDRSDWRLSRVPACSTRRTSRSKALAGSGTVLPVLRDDRTLRRGSSRKSPKA